MTTIAQHLKEIKSNGLTIITNALSEKECTFYTKKANNLIEKMIRNKKTKTFNKKCLWVPSPFRYDKSFFNLLHQPKLDKIFSKLIDKDYVLTNSSIINRKITKNKIIKGENMGDLWHTDSRYIGGKRLQKGFGYIAIWMLEDFKKTNGCTQFIPKSHLLFEKPKRRKKYKFELMTGKKGSIIVMDTGVWHRGGEPSDESRMSIYSYYSPWFVKPYYDFPNIFSKSKNIDNKVKKLLHFNSTPPGINDDRIYTVTKI